MFLAQSYPFSINQTRLTASLVQHSAHTGILEADRTTITGDRISVTNSYNTINTLVLPENLTITDDLVSFTVPDSTENLTLLLIGDSIYGLAKGDRSLLNKGEFAYDWDTKTVSFRRKDGDNLTTNLIVYQSTPLSVILRTTDICLADQPLLKKWNAKERVSLSSSFNSSPSFRFEFQSCRERLGQIKTELANGSQHECFGIKWVVQNLTIANSNYTDQIYVSVNLVHFLASHGNPSRSLLDKPLKLKKRNGDSYLRVRTIGDFAREAGINYRGEAISIRVPRSTSSTATTTLRSLLNSRAITKQGFIYYSDDRVELRSWANTRIHTINESDLKTKQVAFNYQGHGSRVNGVQLATELRNTKIELDFDEDASVENQGVRQEWTFENCDSLFELYSPAREVNGILRSPDAEELRSPLVNFDSSGAFTKKATKTTYVNGTPTFEEEIQTGYAFSSADGGRLSGIYQVEITEQGGIIISLNPTANPQNYWKTVRETISDWIFDSDGYLVDINILGTELSRLQQETDKLEAVELLAEAYASATEDNGITVPDPSLIAQSDAYKFNRNLPIKDNTKYYLEKHRDYFDDVVEPEDCDDLDFVEPKFSYKMLRSQEDYFVAANPKNTEDFVYPPIVSGRYRREVETVKITSSQSPEKYEKRSRAANSEGENLKNALATGNTQYHDGKPSVQKKLDLTWDYENTSLNSNFNYDRYKNSRYYLSSPGVVFEEVKTAENTKSYPDIDDPNEVKAIAETELSIENTQNSVTTSLDIFWRSDMEVGDFALFRGQLWKILQIQTDLSLHPQQTKCDRFEVQLGLYLQPQLIMENRRCFQ